ARAFAAEPIDVFAGIPPVAYLVERIGGGQVHVELLIHSNQDPHTFEPTPKQVQALAKAKVFFKVGMPFEDQLIEKIRSTQPNLEVVDTTQGIEKLRMSATYADDHAQSVVEHSHDGLPTDLDPHVWLSPLLAKKQAANIAAALEKNDPHHAAFFQANLARLQQELDAVDTKISLSLKPYAGSTFYVFHPAFGYFADRYHLKQEAIEAGGRQPSPGQLRRLIQTAKAQNARVIFVQPQFDRHSPETVAQSIGGRIVPINDMDKDVIANLQEIASKIAEALKETHENH
ncbi:MAG TPA: zinc ABC transporter substrate-binding protein, partial [Thermoguttaceae bacterium]